jgi:hypothetical protein
MSMGYMRSVESDRLVRTIAFMAVRVVVSHGGFSEKDSSVETKVNVSFTNHIN